LLRRLGADLARDRVTKFAQTFGNSPPQCCNTASKLRSRVDVKLARATALKQLLGVATSPGRGQDGVMAEGRFETDG